MAYGTPAGLGTNDVSGTGATVAITVGAAVPKGQIAWAGGGASASGALASIADSRGNTWTVDEASAAVRGAGIGSTLVDVAALQIGDTITLTFTTSTSGNRHGWAATATGNASSSVVDKVNTGSNASTAAWSTGATGTLSQATEIIWATAWRAATGTSTPGGSFTELYDFSATGSTLTATYLIVSATTTVTPSGTWSGSGNNWEAETATYKASVGGSTDLIAPATINATSAVTASVAKTALINPATVNATSAMSATVAKTALVKPATINATSAVTAAMVAVRAIKPAAVNSTSTVAATLNVTYSLPVAAVNATSNVTATVTGGTTTPVTFILDQGFQIHHIVRY